MHKFFFTARYHSNGNFYLFLFSSVTYTVTLFHFFFMAIATFPACLITYSVHCLGISYCPFTLYSPFLLMDTHAIHTYMVVTMHIHLVACVPTIHTVVPLPHTTYTCACYECSIYMKYAVQNFEKTPVPPTLYDIVYILGHQSTSVTGMFPRLAKLLLILTFSIKSKHTLCHKVRFCNHKF